MVKTKKKTFEKMYVGQLKKGMKKTMKGHSKHEFGGVF